MHCLLLISNGVCSSFVASIVLGDLFINPTTFSPLTHSIDIVFNFLTFVL